MLIPKFSLALVASLGLVACSSDPEPPTTGSTGDDTDSSDSSGSVSGSPTSDPSGGKDSDTNDDGPSNWVVGEDGLMLRIDADHHVSTYPLDLDNDLRAIACKGASQAVVAGARGLILTTYDGGETWADQQIAGAPELHAVALSAGTTGYVAGTGIVLRSEDDARTWATISTADHPWTAVATTASGTTALLASADGLVFRVQDLEVTQVYAGAVPLRGVAITADGRDAVAVGDTGQVLRSHDRGLTWAAEPPATPHNLHAVRMTADAQALVAIGADATVLHVGGGTTTVTTVLDPPQTLRALHLDHHGDGHGQAVGDHGTLLVTHDDGHTWTKIDIGSQANLLGLDTLHGEPHHH